MSAPPPPHPSASTRAHYCCKEEDWARLRMQLERAENAALEAKRMASETSHETQQVFMAWQLQSKGMVDDIAHQKCILDDQTKDLKQLLTADIRRTTREEDRNAQQSRMEARLAWLIPLVVTTLLAVVGAMAMMVIDKIESAAKANTSEHAPSGRVAGHP